LLLLVGSTMMTLTARLMNRVALPELPAGKPEPSAIQLAPPSTDLNSPAEGCCTVSGSALPTRPLVPT